MALHASRGAGFHEFDFQKRILFITMIIEVNQTEISAILTEGSKLREGIKEVKQSENNLGQVDSKAIEGDRIYSGFAVINLGLEAEWVCLDMALLS